MKRSKKIILAVVMAIVVLASTIGGVALAQTEEEANNQPESRHSAMLEKVCEIYNAANPDAPIDCAALKQAFTQAKDQMMTEARERIRQRLIDEDIMTEEQLDELQEWLDSRPDFPTEEFKGWLESRPDFPTEEFKEWMESRPDDIPFRHGLGDDGRKRCFNRFGQIFRGWHTPDTNGE